MRIIFSITLYLITATKILPWSYGDPILPQPVVLSGLSIRWPCRSTKNIYETGGRYVPKNVIATRAQVYQDKAILAFPRYKPGVPITLGTVPLNSDNCEPSITPFPCWALQEEGNCNALQSVADIVLDLQNILWVLDVGVVNTLQQPVLRCPPKVVGIDVPSGRVVKLIDLSKLTSADSRLQYMAVDYSNDAQVYIYISDAGTNAIIVYNANIDAGYRAILPAAAASRNHAQDALYLALVRQQDTGCVALYFTYLGSSRIFAIEAPNLRRGNGRASVIDIGRKTSQILLLGTDNGSAIFFRAKGDSAIYMWNTETPFHEDNFLLVKRPGECRLPTAVMPGYKDLMWLIESNVQDYIDGTVSCSGASMSLHPLMNTCDK